jgi:hypothetical protein
MNQPEASRPRPGMQVELQGSCLGGDGNRLHSAEAEDWIRAAAKKLEDKVRFGDFPMDQDAGESVPRMLILILGAISGFAVGVLTMWLILR